MMVINIDVELVDLNGECIVGTLALEGNGMPTLRVLQEVPFLHSDTISNELCTLSEWP